ncbi:hypothetical protein F8M41_007809 [Gigaspora margarita]|uniref:Uncharacterized protein n=1 Tax=Gigaspora margarita TaxID=4874 RepID=A0A8H4ER37_GIGMA|nr:hypothetical protein F8M41_007809 [Gigaspora margarita]
MQQLSLIYATLMSVLSAQRDETYNSRPKRRDRNNEGRRCYNCGVWPGTRVGNGYTPLKNLQTNGANGTNGTNGANGANGISY